MTGDSNKIADASGSNSKSWSYDSLFKKLDFRNSGKINIEDIQKGSRNIGLPVDESEASDLVNLGDKDASGDVDREEFVQYMTKHEQQLKKAFDTLDTNHDGRIDLVEIRGGFEASGMSLAEGEASDLMSRVDSDGSNDISFAEWRKFLLFHPKDDIKSILAYWSHRPVLDMGDDLGIPEDFTENELKSGLWWRHLVAGGIAGAVSRTSTAPLDRIKVFLQVHGLKRFGGLKGCLSHMISEGGFRSLWRGNGVNILKIAPESAFKFMGYEQVKRMIRSGDNPGEVRVSERFIAGSCAGAFSQSLIYPLEVLKTRLALSKTGQYRGMFDAALKIRQKEGYRSFYRGFAPNLIGIIPYAGIELGIYETLKTRISQTKEPGILVTLSCATVGSIMGQLCAYPLALVRTKLQAQAIRSDAAEHRPSGMIHVFQTILRTEGWTGLYRGLAPNFLKVLPAVAISYVVYEESRVALGLTTA